MNEMKPSGVAWIGEIPSDWSAGRFKTVLSRNDGGVWGDDPKDDGRDSVVFRSTEQTVDGRWRISEPALRDLRDISNKSNSLLAPGDLLVTKSSGSLLHIGKTSLFEDNTYRGDCYYSNFMQRLRVSNEFYPKFYWYVLNSSVARDQFEYLQNATIGLGNLSSESIGALRVPFPSMSEQKAIADRLDAETAKIDRAVDLLGQQIETLEQLKKSAIHEAVTKGLDLSVPMKRSGVDWIGDIPEGWSYLKIGYIAECLNGDRGENYPSGADMIDVGPVFVSTEAIHGMLVDAAKCKHISEQRFLLLGGVELKRGDIIYCLRGSVGTCALYDLDSTGTVASSLTVIRSEQVDSKWLAYVCKSLVVQDQVEQFMNGSCAANLSAENVLRFKIPLPEISEQQAIAEYLDSRCETIDKALAAKRGQIEVLRKRRQSLIYEYVTGKRRVSEVA